MAFEPLWARSAHVMQFRPVTMDQATKHSANNGEDMHPPNSPKLGPQGWLLPTSLDHWKDVPRRECEMTRVQLVSQIQNPKSQKSKWDPILP
jgi:hypothetical protein